MTRGKDRGQADTHTDFHQGGGDNLLSVSPEGNGRSSFFF